MHSYTRNNSSCDNKDDLNGKPLENPKKIPSTDRNSYILMEIIRQDTEWAVRENYSGFSIIPFYSCLEGQINVFNKTYISTL